MISIMGSLKASYAALSPETVIIDNASSIPVFNISHASFVIRNTYNNYPKGSVHIICVHSEGCEGKDHLIVKAKDHYFIGTDNGIFNLILNSDPDEVVKISYKGINDELDLFARAAADLISGKKPVELGVVIKDFMEKVPLRATIDKDVIIGSIIFIDSYGNAISNITREVFFRVFENKQYLILIQSNKNFTDHISTRYSDEPVGELLARFNSSIFLKSPLMGLMSPNC